MKRFLLVGIVFHGVLAVVCVAMVRAGHPSGEGVVWVTAFGFLVFCVHVLREFLRRRAASRS
ncbi:hypothetical protein [Actinorugispora endophytica]|uniref:Uncharacterized protein n=1 Tax=Actinorugispora endophytica TaxID=1605990 RepID=A0A4R6UXU1_9ACTN|nr:hypothetical protein [Actinorugispora endophytica]TDQ52251.1 hypothetical protein EV190_10783 [Actinorugispora endophytica]